MKSGFYKDRPWYHPIALVRRLMNCYLLICIALFLMQNSLLFPRWISGAVMSGEEGMSRAASVGLVPWGHPKAGATTPQGYVGNDFTKPAPRGTIVVFHGNGGCAFDRAFYVDAFTRRGFRTFLYEYPGYGGRPGKPSAASIVGDAQALIRSLDQAGYGPVYVWGESVGAGIAASVCRDATLPVHGLTMSTPWDTLTNAAAYHYPFMPVSVLLWDKYDSIANLAHFPHPVCVICGTTDPVLPMRLGLNLFDHLSGPKKFISQEGYGHGDWPCEPELTWWDDALNFIAPQNAPGKP
ncbi:MAG TPA: alpha/beta fold hydrolase [Candidatus Methylacidiphilales bacterium]|jgi:pimeloyl-ACP methyl ester carboxylesterase|nr:alpha/beta fold hydrolase [Candidatus Methylacidiphilales bacterium]